MLSVPLHPDWMGGEPTWEYVERLYALGVRGAELNLPFTIVAADLPFWRSFADGGRALDLDLALRVPLPLDAPLWADLLPWINDLADTAPLVILVQGGSAARPQPVLVDITTDQLRALCDRVAPNVTVALEISWNRGAMRGVSARLQHWQQQRRQDRVLRQRPSGVGSGLGTRAVDASARSPADDQIDPPLQEQHAAWIATGTRVATLAIVEHVDRPNCVIAWDLACDWLGSYWQKDDHVAMPPAAFLQRVGYVRVHDALPDGTLNLPLVVGNVAYASQLRALHGAGFDGWACVAVRYTTAAQAFGTRSQLLERSLAITRQALRWPR
jgi:hypothetical protein